MIAIKHLVYEGLIQTCVQQHRLKFGHSIFYTYFSQNPTSSLIY